MVSAVDDGVGRVLAKLEEQAIADNTLIFFLSDNGGPIGKTPSANGSINQPLRGGKGSPFEGGIRVPFAARWTGTIPAGIDYDEPVISLDIFATIAAQAGASSFPGSAARRRQPHPLPVGSKSHEAARAAFLALVRQRDFCCASGCDEAHRDADGRLAAVRPGDRSAANRQSGQPAVQTVEDLQDLVRDWKQDLSEPAFPELGSWKD